nr:MAG TPA: hypothetical protein [Caudoviricetes sp.]
MSESMSRAELEAQFAALDAQLAALEATNAQVNAAPVSEVRSVEIQGIPLTLDPNVFDDFELLDTLNEIQGGNALKSPALLRKVLGDQYKTVLEHLRDPASGRVPASKIAPFMQELMEALAPKS